MENEFVLTDVLNMNIVMNDFLLSHSGIKVTAYYIIIIMKAK